MTHCDFCGGKLEPGQSLHVDIRVSTTPLTHKRGELWSRPHAKVACSSACVDNHVQGIDAGAVVSRHALEAVTLRELGELRAHVDRLRAEIAVFRRGAVRYAARMVLSAAGLAEGAAGKHESVRLIENFSKRLGALREPPSRYQVEWDEARREASSPLARTGS